MNVSLKQIKKISSLKTKKKLTLLNYYIAAVVKVILIILTK